MQQGAPQRSGTAILRDQPDEVGVLGERRQRHGAQATMTGSPRIGLDDTDQQVRREHRRTRDPRPG